MKKIPMLEKFAAQSLVDHDGELIFSKEKFAELIVQECIAKVEMRKKFAIEDEHIVDHAFDLLVYDLESHFGVRE